MTEWIVHIHLIIIQWHNYSSSQCVHKTGQWTFAVVSCNAIMWHNFKRGNKCLSVDELKTLKEHRFRLLPQTCPCRHSIVKGFVVTLSNPLARIAASIHLNFPANRQNIITIPAGRSMVFARPNIKDRCWQPGNRRMTHFMQNCRNEPILST